MLLPPPAVLWCHAASTDASEVQASLSEISTLACPADNCILRSYGNPDHRGLVSFGRFKGELFQDRFIKTLHSINDGIIKLSRLSYAQTVFRGLANIKLPESFLATSSGGTRV